jgi:hypothetical protein
MTRLMYVHRVQCIYVITSGFGRACAHPSFWAQCAPPTHRSFAAPPKIKKFPETPSGPNSGRQGHIFFQWAKLHPAELRCTLLSFAASTWVTLHPIELRCTLLSYAAFKWAMFKSWRDYTLRGHSNVWRLPKYWPPPLLYPPPPPFGAGGGHTRWVERGWGVNSSEDARHCSVLYKCKYFVVKIYFPQKCRSIQRKV